MQRVMTEAEVGFVEDIELLAKERARGLAVELATISGVAVDVALALTCEVAFVKYLPFASKYSAGDPVSIRGLIDAVWQSIKSQNDFPSRKFVGSCLDSASFPAEDWDDPTVSDAEAALCIIDACIADACNPAVRNVNLITGLGELFCHEVKNAVEEYIQKNIPLSVLCEQLKSGVVSFPDERRFLTLLAHVRSIHDLNGGLVDWVRDNLV